MGVEGGQVEEEGSVLRATLHDFGPVLAAARFAALLDDIKASDRVRTEVPLAGRGRVVTGLAQPLGKNRLLGGQGLMQLGGAGGVRVATRHQAAAARAAGTAGEEGVVETQTVGGESVDHWRADAGVAIAAEVLGADVVGDEENEIGSVGRQGGKAEADEEQGKQAEHGKATA